MKLMTKRVNEQTRINIINKTANNHKCERTKGVATMKGDPIRH